MTPGPSPLHHWYRTSDLDHDGVLVMFWFDWGEGLGIKKFTRRGKTAVYRIRRSARHFEDLPKWAVPSLWRPIREDMWPYPLPEPVKVLTPPERPKPAASPRKQRNVVDVTIHRYSPPGEISREEAEIRMIRFIRTEQVTPWSNPTALRTGWPSVVYSLAGMIANWDEAHTYATEAPRPVWIPTPRDIADSEVVAKWFCALNPPGLGGERINGLQEVLIARALEPTPSWSEVGQIIGASDPKDLYRRALNAVHRAANGQPAFPGLDLPDPIEELRRRNRLYRERATVA